MLKNKVFLFFGFLLVLTTQSCDKVKEISSDQKVTEEIEKIELIKQIVNDTIDYKYLFTKVDISVASDVRDASLDLTLKFTKDSALTANVSVFNIIIATALAREDSVFVSNKREKCLIRKEINELADLIGANIGYKELQNLVAGKAFYFDPKINLVQLKRDNFYVLSTHNDDDIKQILKDTKPDKLTNQDRVVRYFFNPLDKKLQAIRVDIPKDTLSLFVEYKSSVFIENIEVPEQTIITLEKGKSTSKFDMKYKKTRINEPRELYFINPSSYEECN